MASTIAPIEIIGPDLESKGFIERFKKSLEHSEYIKGCAGFFTGWGNDPELMNLLNEKLQHGYLYRDINNWPKLFSSRSLLLN